jgi:hypothetical protein
MRGRQIVTRDDEDEIRGISEDEREDKQRYEGEKQLGERSGREMVRERRREIMKRCGKQEIRMIDKEERDGDERR